METGQSFPTLGVNLGILIGLPLVAYIAAGTDLTVEYPVLQGFNFQGGLQVRPEFLALLFGLTIYTAAFIAEIVRAGIMAVSHGQTEASYSLGLRRGRTLRLVVIPQALRVIIPPLTSQYLNLTKNSSLAIAVGYPDLFAIFSKSVLNITGQAIECIVMIMGGLSHDKPADLAVHELVQPQDGAGGAIGDERDRFRGKHRLRPQRPCCAAAAPRFSDGGGRVAARQPIRQRRQRCDHDRLHAPHRLDGDEGVRLGDRAGRLGGRGPPGVPRPGGRRLLGLCAGEVPLLRLRALSVRGALARQRHGRALHRRLRADAHPQGAVQARDGCLSARRLPDPRLHPAHRQARPRAGPHRAVGRAHADAGGGHRRHHRVAADRHRAGARPALEDADRAVFLHRLHRDLARRADGHRALHGERDAAAVPAARHDLRPVAQGARRRDDVLVRLHGGDRARRPAGDPARPVRGGVGARPRLLADDAPDHPAAGAEDRHPRHRQHVHRPLQGYDAGRLRGPLRPARDGAGQPRRPELGDAVHRRHRLRLRGDGLSGSSASGCRAIRCSWSVG